MNYLYYNIDLKISIAQAVEFNVCQSIVIESSVQTLSDTAKIELPRMFKNAVDSSGRSIEIENKSILDYIKRGDSIIIQAGYNGDLVTEFEGYITKIGADFPLVLECEDEMFKLRTAPKVTKWINSGKLIDILKAVIPSKYAIECDGEYSVGKWLIENATPYEVLEELKTKRGIRAYFKNAETLYVGMIVDFKPQKTHQYNFSQNVRRGTNLVFERKESKPLKITVESKQKDGNSLSYSIGEGDGNETTIQWWPNMSISDLKKWADQMHKSRSFDGFEGTLNGWCYPRTKPGDAVEIVRPFWSDGHQDGKYFIEGVTIDINGNDGIKRANKLSFKL